MIQLNYGVLYFEYRWVMTTSAWFTEWVLAFILLYIGYTLSEKFNKEEYFLGFVFFGIPVILVVSYLVSG